MTTAMLPGPAEGRTAVAFPGAREALCHLGFCHLPDLWPPGLIDELAREAQQSPSAPPAPEDGGERKQGGFDTYRLGSGPLLAAVSADRRLLSLVRAVTGQPVVPKFYVYLHYAAGGSMSLHVDRPDADFALSTQLSGDLGPLVVHPELTGQTEEQLDAIEEAAGGHPPGGVPVRYPRQGATLLRGRVMPHRRPPSEQPGVVGLIAYKVRL